MRLLDSELLLIKVDLQITLEDYHKYAFSQRRDRLRDGNNRFMF